MNPQYATVSDIVLAYNEGLLTKAEARLVLRDYFPALRKVAEAHRKVAEAQQVLFESEGN